MVLLRGFEELTFREMGERLCKSPDAVRMLYARAMTALTLAMRRISAAETPPSGGPPPDRVGRS